MKASFKRFLNSRRRRRELDAQGMDDSTKKWIDFFYSFSVNGMPCLNMKGVKAPRVPWYWLRNRFLKFVIVPAGLNIGNLAAIFRNSTLNSIFDLQIDKSLGVNEGRRDAATYAVKKMACHCCALNEFLRLENQDELKQWSGKRFSQMTVLEFLMNFMYTATVYGNIPQYYGDTQIQLAPLSNGCLPIVSIKFSFAPEAGRYFGCPGGVIPMSWFANQKDGGDRSVIKISVIRPPSKLKGLAITIPVIAAV